MPFSFKLKCCWYILLGRGVMVNMRFREDVWECGTGLRIIAYNESIGFEN